MTAVDNPKNLNLDWLISVDDHVLEPPNVWIDRVPAKDKDRAPRLVIEADGSDYWLYEGKKMPGSGLSAVVGKKKEDFSPEPISYSEMAPGCYDPIARLTDMNTAGILASLSFPSLPRFCGQLFAEAEDRDFGLVCLKAYNDWMIDEWCAAAPGRYIPLTLIPIWDTKLAVEEMERTAAKGSHAFCFSENFAPLGYPTINDANGHWEPVLRAANDLEMVACMHVGSSSTLPQIAPDAPFMANLTWGASRTSGTMLAWLFSGWFQKYDNLKIALSEGEVGWIPYFLERAEQVLDKQKGWVKKGIKVDFGSGGAHASAGSVVDLDNLNLRQLYKDHVYGCMIEDKHGVASLREIGEDNVMCETDYPHSDTTWPDSIHMIKRIIDHLPAETQYKILRGNAEKLYHFIPSEPPASYAG